MDIYLTNLTTSDRLQFPTLPPEVSVKIAHQFATYSILRIGEVKIPSGTSADSFSWSGILPGAARRNDPYIRAWKDPKAVYNWLNGLKVVNDKPIKARLLITETPVNCDVYLSNFTATPTGGYGDINYTITLVQARDIIIRKSDKTAMPVPLKNAPPAENAERTSPPPAQTYTVKKGDCLWSIAQQMGLGGANYAKLYDANKGVIDPRNQQHSMPKYTIYPGQVLTIPS